MVKITIFKILFFLPSFIFIGLIFPFFSFVSTATNTVKPTLNSFKLVTPSFSNDDLENELMLNLTNNKMEVDQLPPPKIKNYTQADVEKLLKSFDGDLNTNINIGVGSWEKTMESEPIIKKPIEGWGKLKLGLSYQEVLTVLSNDYPWMILRPQEEEANPDRVFYLESYKNDFFSIVQFQFNSNHRLYLLRLKMNPRHFSFLKIYNQLFRLYGPPQENSYIRVTWKDATRSLELYRNQTVVYLNKEGWNEVLPSSLIEDQRQKFINSVFDDL